MSYNINQETCFACGNCYPQCPTGAIQVNKGKYSIDPELCNYCEGYYSQPQCITVCNTNSPTPKQAKKGRYKTTEFLATSPDLFPNGTINPFASAMVIWEGCKLLSSATILPWQKEANRTLYYQKKVKQGNGAIIFKLTEDSESGQYLVSGKQLENIDIRSAAIHLIYAAYATGLQKPWEEEFILSDQQIEKYLGLDKRKDLSKAQKLSLIKSLAQQPCQITAEIHWPRQGRVNSFVVAEDRIWHLLEIKHFFQTDQEGCKHLSGLTFRIRPGLWSQYFLNKYSYRQQTAYYQYGTLPSFILKAVNSVWQQHQGAVRMMLWLVFKLKMSNQKCITVPTLMRVAYGEEKLNQANLKRELRKRLIRTFESDLEVLNHYGIKPIFDPVTYPEKLQPLWAKLAEIPDDPEEALLFWLNDGSKENSLTDISPRGKWQLLMKAKITKFAIPPEWQEKVTKLEGKKQQKTRKNTSKRGLLLSPEQILQARQNQGLSQRKLAELLKKSQSWVRDLEQGRFQAKSKDQKLLRELLGLK